WNVTRNISQGKTQCQEKDKEKLIGITSQKACWIIPITLCLYIIINPLTALDKKPKLQTARLFNGMELEGELIHKDDKKVVLRIYTLKVPEALIPSTTEKIQPKSKKVFGKIILEGGESIFAWYKVAKDGSIAIYSHRYLKDGTKIKAQAIINKKPLDLYNVTIGGNRVLKMALIHKDAYWEFTPAEFHLKDSTFKRREILLLGESSNELNLRTATGILLGYEKAPPILASVYSGGLGLSFFVNTGITPLLNLHTVYIHLEIGANTFPSKYENYSQAFLTRAGLGIGYKYTLHDSLLLTYQLGFLVQYRHTYLEFSKYKQKKTSLHGDIAMSLDFTISFSHLYFVGIQSDVNYFPSDKPYTSFGIYLRTGFYFL
ncbi:MAG: hypothetical protein D6767_09580, partial [Candidatus Hydrogenedentota bacterium]